MQTSFIELKPCSIQGNRQRAYLYELLCNDFFVLINSLPALNLCNKLRRICKARAVQEMLELNVGAGGDPGYLLQKDGGGPQNVRFLLAMHG